MQVGLGRERLEQHVGAPIRVNDVSPGLVDTPWWDGFPPEARAANFAQMAERLPTRRVATAEDVAEVVALAATNPNLTGTVIEADGGARLAALTEKSRLAILTQERAILTQERAILTQERG